MPNATDTLPDSLDALRSFAVGLQAELARKDIEIAARDAEIYAKTLHIEKLKMQLATLRRARFGRSSEKLDHEIEQLELLIGELEEEAAEEDARATTADPAAAPDPDAQNRDTKSAAPTRPRKQPGRPRLPEHLPREIVTREPACICPGCGGTVFSRIGQDEREVLEYIPASFKVSQHIRPKMSCRACETIVQAPMPSLPIERGRPGPGLLAHVAIAKFCDHLPLHRQSAIYAREGVELDRATMADWMGKAVFLLTPLAEAIGRHVRAGAVPHADDTTVPVLAPGLGKTATGRLWVLVRDEVQGERGLVVMVEIGPVHRHKNVPRRADLMRHPARETVPRVDAGVAQHPVDLFDRVLGDQALRLRERLSDQRHRERRGLHDAECGAGQ
jgi:transposase